MTRDEAVVRINEGVGFRASGHSLEDAIIRRLQEAQRDLEKGKTLPKFLLQEDQTLTLLSTAHTAALPTGFLREYDENPLHYTPEGSDLPIFLARKFYIDAVLANIRESSDAVAPSVYVIRKSTVDFVTTADRTYTLTWSYYKAAALLTSNIENEWLASAPDWLIGEAGYRFAKNLRDKDAAGDFAEMRQAGRAAIFGEILAGEEASGPYVMGANL